MRQLSGSERTSRDKGRRFANRVNARHWNRWARASTIGIWPFVILWRAASTLNHCALSASGNSRMRPDFGGHSIENLLLRNAIRSKSFSTAQTEITFLLGCLNAPSSIDPCIGAGDQRAQARSAPADRRVRLAGLP